jgi:imidazolonepropionase-like amidohydrolase
MSGYTVIRARKLIDGTGNRPLDYPMVVLKDSRIVDVGNEDQLDPPRGEYVKQITLENETLLPGLIDSHVHLALGTCGSYDEMMNETDGVQLLTGVANAREALRAGITLVKDAGARNRVTLDLKEGWKQGMILAPRLYVSGRPLTVPGGHFHFCNNNECSGVEEVREKVKQFVNEKVDIIKIMASGGGTKGTSNRQSAFTEDELRVAVEEAHLFNKTTMAHCEAYESVGNAARAGVDVLEHCGFILPDGTRGFDKSAVRTVVKNNLFYNPTLQTGSTVRDNLQLRSERGETLLNREKSILEELNYKIRKKSENLISMFKMGVQIVAGSDGIGLGTSTQLLRTLELMVDAGLSPMDVIISATSNAARALKMNHILGTITKGLEADMIAVKGNPLENISNLRFVKMVIQRGQTVRLNKGL